MPKDKGGKPSIKKDFNRSQASTGVNNLKDLGISKDQSSQWQKIAKMSESV